MSRRTFDGMFRHALRPDPALANALRGVGYDLDAPREEYSAEVWRDAVEVARGHLYSELPRAEGLRLLGHHFIGGYARTVVGHVLVAAAPLLGPERSLTRLPRYLRTARTDIEIAMTNLGPHHWRAEVTSPAPMPEMMAGIFEAILELAGVIVRAEVVQASATVFTVDLCW